MAARDCEMDRTGEQRDPRLWPEECAETLRPAQWFDDAEPTTRQRELLYGGEEPASETAAQVLGEWLRTHCTEWREQPGSAELSRAFETETPTPGERRLLDAWANRATPAEALRAWTAGAFTLRRLAQALHSAGLERCRLARSLNNWASGPATEGAGQ